ncbi:class I SAM-dependent methyltransferase [Phormidium sp. LEGE 05292]|uniref:class I SAM-dependent methyltransferase n=1 Tax=[Phormidium] sp. LEGE 05292 TaxID=767427 RepID=UPI0018818DEF|nr:class I SAM-dependent methyltransferase [Phormidium sp. LEGE 05292]MBE9223905.1 class I SAM-dependent methyltransferase [Phormidium sp. LEGE 05292]
MIALKKAFCNKEVYQTKEFSRWAYGNGLSSEEQYLIANYLDRSKKTVEAGTGGGRLLLEMSKLGFTSLYGFDYLPEFIEVAKQRDVDSNIDFQVQDATQLNYEDCSFDQILYLGQMISSIDDELGRLKALKEAYRILKVGGTALFSFLSFDSRLSSALYRPYVEYIRLLRKLRGSNRSIQYLPWLRFEKRPNLAALFDEGAHVYWYKLPEAYQLLTDVNFDVVAFGSRYQLSQGRIHESLTTLANEPIRGMLYFVCKK